MHIFLSLLYDCELGISDVVDLAMSMFAVTLTSTQG